MPIGWRNQTGGGLNGFGFRTNGYNAKTYVWSMGYSKPIETADAIYVMSYENHVFPDRSVLAKYAPDAIFFEGWDWEKDSSRLERIVELNRRVKNCSFFTLEPTMNAKGQLRAAAELVGYPALIASLFVLLLKSAQRDARKDKVTRRTVMKRIVGLAGLFGMSGFYLLSSPNTFPGELEKRKYLEWALQKQSRLSPFLVMVRDAIIAEKSTYIAQQINRELGRKPLIVVQVGAKHLGIATLLQDAPLRKNVLMESREVIRSSFKNETLDHVERIIVERGKPRVVKMLAPITPAMDGKKNGRAPPLPGKRETTSRRGLFRRFRPRRV